MEIDANLVIRWQERGGFEVGLVPADPPGAAPGRIRRLADVDALDRLLTDLGLPPDRAAQILRSPYVLQSQRVRVDRRAAERLGLLPMTGLQQALGRLARLVTRRPPGDDRP